ncbi:MAG: hypothetical protein ACFCVG_05715 [Kineosporiaceae bacterium]
MTRRPSLRVPAVLAVAALSLAGCSTGDEPDTGAAGSGSPSGPGAAGSVSAAAGSSLEPSPSGPGSAAPSQEAPPPAGTGEVVPGAELADRVLAAAAAAGGARVTLESTLEESSLSAEGVVQFSDPYRADVTTTVGSEGGDLVSRILVLSPTEAYVRLPETGGWIPIAGGDELGMTGAVGTEYVSPESTWQVWGTSGDFEVVGTEDVGGVSATRYRLTDVAGAAVTSPGLESVEVWVGPGDLPVRSELTVSDPQPATVTVDYREWGEPVSVEAPPPDEILEF